MSLANPGLAQEPLTAGPSLLSAIIQAQADIAAQLNLGHVAATASRRAQELTGASAATVELAEGEELVLRGTSGVASLQLGSRVKQQGSLGGLAMMTGKLVVCDDVESDPRVNQLKCRRIQARSMMVVPLHDWGTIVGALNLFSSQPAAFRQPSIEAARVLGRFVGSAIARAAAFEAASHGAMHDSLTGLPNRALLEDRLRHELSIAQRTRQAIGIAFIDLNGFKQVNDTMGHQWGDTLLVKVARRLTRLLRGSDTLARLGGDEFVVVAPQLIDASSLELVVGRIHEAIARPFVVGGRRICIGASIGTCYADNPSLPAAELLARADNAMYVEKRRHHAAREGAAAIATPAAPLTATL